MDVCGENHFPTQTLGPEGGDHPTVLTLPKHDVGHAQCAADHEDRDHRETECQFVGDHLRAGADAAEEGVFRVRGPAGQHDAIDPKRGNGENVKNAHVDIGDHHRNSK